MSIRYKVILPYLLLTLIVAVTGAYVIIRLVAGSLEERLANQLFEAGRVVSDVMARQEIRHLESARIIAYTRGLGDALREGNVNQVSGLAGPAAAGANVENLLIYDLQGQEVLHLIKQPNGQIGDVTQPGRASSLSIVNELLAENDVNSLPRRMFEKDSIDGRYYYFTAIPAPSSDGISGIVVVGTSVNTLLPILKNTSLADVSIYNEERQAIATTLGTQETQSLFLQTITIPEDLYQQIIEKEGLVQGRNIEADGRSFSVAYSPLNIGDDRIAVFSVLLPLDFVLQSGSLSRNTYIVIYTFATLAVILIGYFVTRLIIIPLSALVRTSLAIAAGDLSRRTQIKSRDEIGVLATTFDHMTESLQQRTLELERMNKILEQMDKTKTRFIQVSAHELRTPLTLVQGYAQMAQIKAAGNKDLIKYTNGILEGTTRMVEIIDSMLDVSRIDSNLLELNISEVDIPSVIERVSQTFRTAFEERNLTFKAEDLAGLPTIRADKELLYKVFYHVIGNAIKYTPDGGRITVRARVIHESPQNPEIEINVCDTGIGIDPQYHELVFEKFFQTGEVLLHSSGKTKFKGGGPGLGLAIARGIVNAHHGHIWIESPGYNEETRPGTTVHVRLPVNGTAP